MNTVYADKEYCSGCGACSHSCSLGAIEMKEDNEGFFYPVINHNKCINCGKCKAVCPFVKENVEFTIPDVYAVKNKSDIIRKESASGGVFSAISDYILEQNGVVYGVIFNENMKAEHIRTTTKDERNKMLGSKYMQCIPSNIFEQVKKDLEENRLTLFSGTPCQIAGLKHYLGKKYSLLVLCDIVCHGVGSPKIFEDYKNYLEKKYQSNITTMCFRDKTQGWSKQKWKVILQNDEELCDNKMINIYKRLYYSSLIQRPSCHKCTFTKVYRQGDITIGDFWGLEKSMPEFVDELGVSLVLVNSKKGRVIFDKVKDGLLYQKSDIDNCLQPQLQYPTEKSHKREKFWLDYKKRGFEYVANKYGTATIIERIKYKLLKCLNKN